MFPPPSMGQSPVCGLAGSWTGYVSLVKPFSCHALGQCHWEWHQACMLTNRRDRTLRLDYSLHFFSILQIQNLLQKQVVSINLYNTDIRSYSPYLLATKKQILPLHRSNRRRCIPTQGDTTHTLVWASSIVIGSVRPTHSMHWPTCRRS